MDAAKITLSEEEMMLVENADWILTKNEILRKAFQLLDNVQTGIRSHPQTEKLSLELTRIPAKISQGENYLGLPYRILDFPRLFTKQDCFAIRCFFWWGKFFSITLHLKGRYLDFYRTAIASNFDRLQLEGFYMSVGIDEWQHHFETDNLQPLREIESAEFTALLSNAPFLKIASRLPVSQWANAAEWLLKNYALIVEMINSRGDGTDL